MNLRRPERARNEGSTGPKRLDDTRCATYRRRINYGTEKLTSRLPTQTGSWLSDRRPGGGGGGRKQTAISWMYLLCGNPSDRIPEYTWERVGSDPASQTSARRQNLLFCQDPCHSGRMQNCVQFGVGSAEEAVLGERECVEKRPSNFEDTRGQNETYQELDGVEHDVDADGGYEWPRVNLRHSAFSSFPFNRPTLPICLLKAGNRNREVGSQLLRNLRRRNLASTLSANSSKRSLVRTVSRTLKGGSTGTSGLALVGDILD